LLVRVKQLGLFITILIFRNGYINVCFAGQKEDNSHHTSTFEEKEKKQSGSNTMYVETNVGIAANVYTINIPPR